MSYLSNAGRVRRMPIPIHAPMGIPQRRAVTGLADTPAAPASEIPWKTIAVLAALPIVFAITGDK